MVENISAVFTAVFIAGGNNTARHGAVRSDKDASKLTVFVGRH
jgi:hypothetical protein